jgi:RimJ/RimL family protein N-acetyltransferase
MFARTQRLLLRPGWPEDDQAVYSAINDFAIVSMLARAPWPYYLSDAQQWLRCEPDIMLPNFLLFERTGGDPQLVGSCGLGESPDGAVEIGYWIRRSHWGRGFAGEAAGHVLRVAKMLGHRQLAAGHFTSNPASGAVLRKIGFRATGQVVPRHSAARGKAAPCALYAIDLDAAIAEGRTSGAGVEASEGQRDDSDGPVAFMPSLAA